MQLCAVHRWDVLRQRKSDALSAFMARTIILLDLDILKLLQMETSCHHHLGVQ